MNKQADYWDSVAESKECTHPFCFDKFELSISKTASILDYGCGYGRIMNELYKNGYRNLVGLDFSSQNSTTNTERYKKFHKKYDCYGVFELSGGAILRHHTIEYLEQLTSQFVKIWDRNVEVTTMNGNEWQSLHCFSISG